MIFLIIYGIVAFIAFKKKFKKVFWENFAISLTLILVGDYFLADLASGNLIRIIIFLVCRALPLYLLSKAFRKQTKQTKP